MSRHFSEKYLESRAAKLFIKKAHFLKVGAKDALNITLDIKYGVVVPGRTNSNRPIQF